MKSATTLQDLAPRLRKGEITEVADMTHYSVSHVSNVIAGRRNDTDGVILQSVRVLTKGRKK